MRLSVLIADPLTSLGRKIRNELSPPMKVRIARSGKEIGTFNAEEAVRLLALGQLLSTDYFWHEGMANWALLPNLKNSEELRLKSEAEKMVNREKLEKEKREDEDRLRQKVEEAVKQRLAEERANGGQGKEGEENNLGCFGGALFVGGVVAVLGAYSSRNNAQRASDGLTFLSGSRRYTAIDSSGYDAFTFVAGAVALLGLGLIIAGLARKK